MFSSAILFAKATDESETNMRYMVGLPDEDLGIIQICTTKPHNEMNISEPEQESRFLLPVQGLLERKAQSSDIAALFILIMHLTSCDLGMRLEAWEIMACMLKHLNLGRKDSLRKWQSSWCSVIIVFSQKAGVEV